MGDAHVGSPSAPRRSARAESTAPALGLTRPGSSGISRIQFSPFYESFRDDSRNLRLKKICAFVSSNRGPQQYLSNSILGIPQVARLDPRRRLPGEPIGAQGARAPELHAPGAGQRLPGLGAALARPLPRGPRRVCPGPPEAGGHAAYARHGALGIAAAFVWRELHGLVSARSGLLAPRRALARQEVLVILMLILITLILILILILMLILILLIIQMLI